MLAKYSQAAGCCVKYGIFLHIPWPSSDMIKALPVRNELLRGILCFDLIGFQIFDYARHFLLACQRLLKAPYLFKKGGLLTLQYNNKSILICAKHLCLPQFKEKEVTPSEGCEDFEEDASARKRVPTKFDEEEPQSRRRRRRSSENSGQRSRAKSDVSYDTVVIEEKRSSTKTDIGLHAKSMTCCRSYADYLKGLAMVATPKAILKNLPIDYQRKVIFERRLKFCPRSPKKRISKVVQNQLISTQARSRVWYVFEDPNFYLIFFGQATIWHVVHAAYGKRRPKTSCFSPEEWGDAGTKN